VADIPTQDRCLPTLELQGVPFDHNPTVRLEGDLPFQLVGDDAEVPAVIQEGAITLTFGDDRTLRFSGLVDTRSLEGAYGENGAAVGDVCDEAATWGDPCVVCPDGATSCLPTGGYLHMDAEPVPGLALIRRTSTEIAADPACR
jgi:hypothetical protein